MGGWVGGWEGEGRREGEDKGRKWKEGKSKRLPVVLICTFSSV